jgi:predicted membrane protein
VIVAWGALLLAREFGAIDPNVHALDFWPLLLIGFGLSALLRMRSLGGVLVGLAVGLLGGGLLAAKLGYAVPAVGHLWPLLIMGVGLGILWKALTHRRSHTMGNETVSADELRRSVTMGGLTLMVSSQQFKGGTLHATMSGVQIDLRRATISGDEATLELSLLMSGVELYVPTSWRVVNDLSPFMGAVEDKTELQPDAAGLQKKLVLRGGMTMSAVTIKN